VKIPFDVIKKHVLPFVDTTTLISSRLVSKRFYEVVLPILCSGLLVVAPQMASSLWVLDKHTGTKLGSFPVKGDSYVRLFAKKRHCQSLRGKKASSLQFSIV
jgi:hypothetical protein